MTAEMRFDKGGAEQEAAFRNACLALPDGYDAVALVFRSDALPFLAIAGDGVPAMGWREMPDGTDAWTPIFPQRPHS